MSTRQDIRKGTFGDPKTENQILFAKRVNFIVLVALIAFLALTVYLVLGMKKTKDALSASREELTTKNILLEANKDALERKERELAILNDSLAAQKRRADSAFLELAVTVQEREYTQARRLAEEYLPDDPQSPPSWRANIFVNIYSYRAPQNLLDKVMKYVEAQGFNLNLKEELGEVKTWLRSSPVVEYYRPEMQSKAAAIQQALSKETGTPFELVPRLDDLRQQDRDWIGIIVVGPHVRDEIHKMNNTYQMIQQQRGR